MWMNLLPTKIKENYTRTFLACIQNKYPQGLQQKKHQIISTKQDTEDVVCYPIKGSDLKKELKSDKSILDCHFTVYCPAVFREIIETAWQSVDIFQSLDISKNEDKIKKAGESGGGASGELFMFTHDHKLILKTANHDEVEVFKNIMLGYKDHFRLNPKSQISKIFGLFDFNFEGSDKSIKLILMENLFVLPSRSLLRKYDMKGSRHSRKVLKDYKDIKESSVVTSIMKDLDFIEIDQSIKLNTQQREELIRSIESDVHFFTTNQIIDYSIILAVVDRKLFEQPQKSIKDEAIEESGLKTSRRNTVSTARSSMIESSELSLNLLKNHHILQSINDPDRLFIIGIIDYFQLYDLQKSAERFFKRLMACNPKLDTSSQPPSIYSERFIKWVKAIVTTPT